MKKLLLVILACLSIASCSKKSTLDGTSWFVTFQPEGLTEHDDLTIVFASNDKVFVLAKAWHSEAGYKTFWMQQSGTYTYNAPNITILCPEATNGSSTEGGMNALSFSGTVNGNQMTLLAKGFSEDITLTFNKQ